MVVVKKKKGESDDRLISRFRKLSSKIISEYKKRERYTKPSEEKQERLKRARYRDEIESEKEQ